MLPGGKDTGSKHNFNFKETSKDNFKFETPVQTKYGPSANQKTEGHKSVSRTVKKVTVSTSFIRASASTVKQGTNQQSAHTDNKRALSLVAQPSKIKGIASPIKVKMI